MQHNIKHKTHQNTEHMIQQNQTTNHKKTQYATQNKTKHNIKHKHNKTQSTIQKILHNENHKV